MGAGHSRPSRDPETPATRPRNNSAMPQLKYEVSVWSSTGEEVRRLLLTIKPQAPVVHQSFQLYCTAAEVSLCLSGHGPSSNLFVPKQQREA